MIASGSGQQEIEVSIALFISGQCHNYELTFQAQKVCD
jgi:hypothetical protein